MTAFTVYDVNTGAILRSGDAPDNMVDMQASSADEGVVRAKSVDTEGYVDVVAGEVKSRAQMSLSVTTATGETTIDNLPASSTITWEGNEVVVDDGTVTITFNEAGTYELEVTLEPQYTPETLTVYIP